MNNSYPRLIKGVIEFLNDEVIPELKGDYLRSQVYGAIYILKQLDIRGDWSVDFIKEELDLQSELFKKIRTYCVEFGVVPPKMTNWDNLQIQNSSQLSDLKDQRNLDVEKILDWLRMEGQALPPALFKEIEKLIKTYMLEEVRTEKNYTAKSMFAEISQNSES